MFGITSTFQYIGIISYVSLVIIFSSLLALALETIIVKSLNKWIESFKYDEKTIELDKQDLIKVQDIIRKTIVCLFSGQIMYIFVYILQ